jgi:hypothetical protein
MWWPARAVARFGRLSSGERRGPAEALVLSPPVHVLQQACQRRQGLLEKPSSPCVQDGRSVAQVIPAAQRVQQVLAGAYRCLPLAGATHVPVPALEQVLT